ncbi:NAD-dependent epimerase/dehydratase family protein [Microbacterium rhizosphaerae]|uniref:NAD-dependent epimerase/dehydratase family protein n=1 Tax=Microbacterium rhizosphaerae TaxID=1678237 RepID=A0ABZ0SRM4_9MICO|nr:NAD-dependent epimerase/dehydratase family protein [Microbacterium rhizosphaerae]WPR90815.1 NAD-dependent epimerase/dehydratase family protein [Microbacterium rhizosphaerae]
MTGRLVITGVDGFVGRHLAHAAADAGLDVFGIARAPISDAALLPWLGGHAAVDLRSEWPREAPLDEPIVHLAGLAAVGPSFDHPQRYISSNSAMVTKMCEALLRAGTAPRVVVVSSGAVYAPNDEDPLRAETDPVAFTSPYVVSKVLVENQVAYYRRRGLDIVVARPFNHIGPGQSSGFLVPDLLVRLKSLGDSDVLRVGNLATRRDYTDVRDVVRAYLSLASALTLDHDVYNVASGVSRSGEEILEMLCACLAIATPRLITEDEKIRATDPAIIVGRAERIAADVGWHPTIPFAQTIADAVSASV